MSELYDQIVSQRGSFENLLARLPGFRGYVDKTARRTADRMLRDHLADALEQRLSRLNGIAERAFDGGGGLGIGTMGRIQSVRTKLQTFHDRVKTAAPGYSGFMEAVKVGPEELERIYSFDEALMRYTDKIDEALTTLDQAVTSKQGVDDALASLDKLAVEANEAFALRDDVLTNLSKTLQA